jgi:hypothetical protein
MKMRFPSFQMHNGNLPPAREMDAQRRENNRINACLSFVLTSDVLQILLRIEIIDCHSLFFLILLFEHYIRLANLITLKAG